MIHYSLREIHLLISHKNPSNAKSDASPLSLISESTYIAVRDVRRFYEPNEIDSNKLFTIVQKIFLASKMTDDSET